MMRGSLLLLVGSIATLMASLAIRRLFLSDIVPVAWADGPQPLWAVEAAFLLRATEFVAIGTTALACLAIAGLMSARWREGEPPGLT